MPSAVQDQYEAYPYPERNPEDERERLITGSPSNPVEIDHFVYRGVRDWSEPIRILVAGGGSGDALIQMAQVLTDAQKPYEIIYIDLSTASRKIAEARADVRGLKHITFVTDSLLNAPDYGPFDYIDCCGVLHHLEDPQAGFTALAGALAPDGALGFMVYAPYGRSGVYPLQEAFGALSAGMTPQDRLEFAKTVFPRIPQNHPFKHNALLGDHMQSDAGFYDLLLHTQDCASRVTDVAQYLERAGLELISFIQPALYRLEGLVPPDFALLEALTQVEEMALAEKLRGTFKTHVGYARKARADVGAAVDPLRLDAVPHFMLGDPGQAKTVILERGGLPLNINGQKIGIGLSPEAADLIGWIDGRTTVGEILNASGMTHGAFAAHWPRLSDLLGGYGGLLYSGLYQ